MPREGFLSASQVAAAVGLNPHCSTKALWERITGKRPPQPDNPNMARGRRHEADAQRNVEVDLGVLIYDRQRWVESEFYGATLDGLALITRRPEWHPAIELELAVVEVKCPVSMYDTVPVYYVPQVMQQMFCAEADFGIFSAWVEGKSRHWLLEFNDDYWAWVDDRARIFWGCVQADTLPSKWKKEEPPKVQITEITE